jgi:hypothetical protein
VVQVKNKQRALADETGSIAPLAIGLASVLLATTFTFVNVGSLLLFQQRETQQAEALALAVDEALTADQLADATTNDSLLAEQAASFAAEAGIADFVAGTNDGLTVTAKVCGVFNAPIAVPLVGQSLGAAAQKVCATAKARKI